jgi:catechol 2,3-dioxygenase-like lactoylglutathione lyase family enzyme
MFGFEVIGNKIHHIRRAETPDASTFSLYPAALQDVKVACMATGNGVGLEVFEFIEPKTYVPEESFVYQRGGFFHISVTDPDPDALVKRMIAAGGSQIGVTVRPVSEVKCVYATDPWGNVFEILDISFERFASLFHAGHR